MILKETIRTVCYCRLLFLSPLGCRHPHLRERNSRVSFLLCLILWLLPIYQSANALQLSSDSEVATAGYFQLHWTSAGKIIQLQESGSADFKIYKTVYEGEDLARVVSGKPNGDYYYRLTTPDGEHTQISNVVKVTVSHHSLVNAFLFFIAGAIVFVAILILIIRGNRQTTDI